MVLILSSEGNDEGDTAIDELVIVVIQGYLCKRWVLGSQGAGGKVHCKPLLRILRCRICKGGQEFDVVCSSVGPMRQQYSSV